MASDFAYCPAQVQFSCIERYRLFDFIRRKVYDMHNKNAKGPINGRIIQ